MKLIVGLGNPGDKYEATRHNLGFMVVERFLKDTQTLKNSEWEENKKLKSNIARLHTPDEIILAKPLTFMNNSGMAVSLLANYYKIEPENIWVIYDEMDLPLGNIKIRYAGAAGGHHGVESIIESLGTDKFWRFRLGIGVNNHVTHNKGDGEKKHESVGRHKVTNGADFVLGTFSTKEASEVKKMAKSASNALQVALEKGLEKAQNQFNTK